MHPGHDGAGGDPYGDGAYGEGAYGGEDPYAGGAHAGEAYGRSGPEFESHTSPWFRPQQAQQAQQPQQAQPPPAQARGTGDTGTSWAQEPSPGYDTAYDTAYDASYDPSAYDPSAYDPAVHERAYEPSTTSSWASTDPAAEPEAPRIEWGSGVSETAALPVMDPDLDPGLDLDSVPNSEPLSSRRSAKSEEEDRTVGLRRPDEASLGRAARRKAAAKGRGRKGKSKSKGKGRAPAVPPARAGTRLEARRAARAAKDGPVVILSRFIGEVFITCGVLMLLFVVYQLWWTNILAHQAANKAADELEDRWAKDPERKPGKFSAGEGFAIMYIPKLDIRVPIAEGVDKRSVLDKGMVGHYDAKSGLETAMPWDKKGNFSLAGHRNTHGEPFRYINKLTAGDTIVVETGDTYYTYKMHSRLPETSPSNTSVIQPVPPQSGFTGPGRYVTLTTCTPEFTSKYRLIVWGKMVEERPRSKGKPDALVG